MGTAADYITDLDTIGIIDTDIIALIGQVHILFPSISLHQSPNAKTQKNIRDKNTLIEIKYREQDLVKRVNDPFRSVKTPVALGVYFNGTIFAIFRKTNAQDDPYEPLTILDSTVYLNAAAYIHSFFEEDPGVETEIGYIVFSGDLPEVPNGMNPVVSYPLSNPTTEAYVDELLDFTFEYLVP